MDAPKPPIPPAPEDNDNHLKRLALQGPNLPPAEVNWLLEKLMQARVGLKMIANDEEGKMGPFASRFAEAILSDGD